MTTAKKGWAKFPRCHSEANRQLHKLLTGRSKPFWEDPQPQRPYDRGSGSLADSGTAWRTCSYCGSIHPNDLLAFMALSEVYLTLSPDEYGLPHKINVHGLPNPHSGLIVQYGTSNGEPMYGKAPDSSIAKFYTVHFEDALDEATFRNLANEIEIRIPNINLRKHINDVSHEGDFRV